MPSGPASLRRCSASAGRDLYFVRVEGGCRGQDILYTDWSHLCLQLPDHDRTVSAAASVWSQCHMHMPQDVRVRGLLLIVPCRTKSEHTWRPHTQEVQPNAGFDLCAIRRRRTFFQQWLVVHQCLLVLVLVGAVFRSTHTPSDRVTAPAACATSPWWSCPHKSCQVQL